MTANQQSANDFTPGDLTTDFEEDNDDDDLVCLEIKQGDAAGTPIALLEQIQEDSQE